MTPEPGNLLGLAVLIGDFLLGLVNPEHNFLPSKATEHSAISAGPRRVSKTRAAFSPDLLGPATFLLGLLRGSVDPRHPTRRLGRSDPDCDVRCLRCCPPPAPRTCGGAAWRSSSPRRAMRFLQRVRFRLVQVGLGWFRLV